MRFAGSTLFALVLSLALGGYGDVTAPKGAIAVDGKLDEPAWAAADWEDGFAVLADAKAVYVAMRDCGKGAEVCLAPSGSTFSFYRFGVDAAAKPGFFARFYSEDGAIEPDPYGPDWTFAAADGKDGRTVEFAIPLSAFYMSCGGWSDTWLYEGVRGRAADARIDPKRFRKLKGFPRRSTTDEFVTKTVWPVMDAAADGRITGRLQITAQPGVVGEFELTLSSSDRPVRVRLDSGDNRVEAPCAYPSNGLYRTRIAFRDKDGNVFARDYPVRIAFEPVRVKLTTPQYRNNFYPGQDADTVAGEIAILDGSVGEAVLEGPGFPTRRQKLDAKTTSFSFDTKGFRDGEAWLTVKTGTGQKRVKIRKLPPTGHRMVWVENGHLVVNGKRTLRRNIYAEGYRGGTKLNKRYYGKDSKELFHLTPELNDYFDISPGRVMPGLEEREARRDVKPCQEFLDRLDKIVAENRDKDFGAYYICDEPECRGVSPVYLRYVYEHMCEIDPYHPCFTASRAGKTYIDCVDWAETHPYLSARNQPDGTRTYGTPPWLMGDHLDAFEAWDRPDKVIGYLPTCFAYRWSSSREDYPTMDEYVLMTWAAMMRGGKSLWPYAYHDIADRPALYRGTQYIFESFEALQDLVLLGKRTTFAKSRDAEGVLYELKDEKMLVAVNFTTRSLEVELPETGDVFREFRGERVLDTRTKDGGRRTKVKLRPLEALVATTKPHDAGLKPAAEVFAEVAAAEQARRTRDNQLLERQDDIVLDTNLDGNLGGGSYKLFDGMYDQFARGKEWLTNAYVTLSFPKFTPTFRYVRLHGCGILNNAEVSIRKRGQWQKLRPVAEKHEEYFCELDFGTPVSTVKLRIDFPCKTMDKNLIELYEIELPRVAGAGTEARRKAEPAADRGVMWRKGPFESGENTGFGVDVDPSCKWCVVDVKGFRDKPGAGYRAWVSSTVGQGQLAGTVTHPQPGIYTIRLPKPYPGVQRDRICYWHYGIVGEYNDIAMMEEPANRVELTSRTDGKVGRGDVLTIRAVFAEPCEDVAAEILRAAGYGDLLPFKVNGGHCPDLRQLDEAGCVWGTELKVETCAFAKPCEVYVKVQPLGGALKRPLLSRFQPAFEETRK